MQDRGDRRTDMRSNWNGQTETYIQTDRQTDVKSIKNLFLTLSGRRRRSCGTCFGLHQPTNQPSIHPFMHIQQCATCNNVLKQAGAHVPEENESCVSSAICRSPTALFWDKKNRNWFYWWKTQMEIEAIANRKEMLNKCFPSFFWYVFRKGLDYSSLVIEMYTHK